MIVRLVLILALLAAPGAASRAAAAEAAGSDEACQVPARVTPSELHLPAVAERIRSGGPLPIVVVGSASSAGAGIGGAPQAYPNRLKAELSKRFPNLEVTVENLSLRGRTATEMADIIVRQVVPLRPALVIWQTGTVEAVRGIDIGDLGANLLAGIQVLRRTPTDVILMTPQYSPRTAVMIDLGRYAEYMERIAEVNDTGRIDRYEIMRYWVEEGLVSFDTSSPAEQQKLVDRIHGCLAQLLADRIEAAAKTLQPSAAPAPAR